MLEELQYPFNAKEIMLKKKVLLSKILQNKENIKTKTKIAILGGSTTRDIKDILNLFLLNYGIESEFYESEYNKYWEDIIFDNEDLIKFNPDIIYIHTSSRNIIEWPKLDNSVEQIDQLLQLQYEHFQSMWDKIFETYSCAIIQNNFEQPWYRLLGNYDVSNCHGYTNYLMRLNCLFYKYSEAHNNFYINDINYMSSCYGLQKWSDPLYWAMYKYIMPLDAIPEFSYNLANIIKSLYGKNKKAYVLDLDNTLWGGIIGEEGPENIEIGNETATAELYAEIQSYLKLHTKLGILLNIDSKNDEENALKGLSRPDSVLKREDFTSIRANWEPKSVNLKSIADELNISQDSIVFVDDSPAERHIIKSQNPTVAVPDIADSNRGPEEYIHILDRSGFFEVTNLNSDDLKRNQMYKENVERSQQQAKFSDYTEYLKSLQMKAEISSFSECYMSRISQLTNKSNQFNLTTHRYTQAEIENFSVDSEYLTLYGKLSDCFGDNGIVSVIIGHLGKPDEDEKRLACAVQKMDQISKHTSLNLDLWLMSCRVLKRGMEYAMMERLLDGAYKMGVSWIYGYFYPTKKNAMVQDLYNDLGFTCLCVQEDGKRIFEYEIEKKRFNKKIVIELNEEK